MANALPLRRPPNLPVWLLAATVLAYLNTLTAAFQFDDYNVIVDHPQVHSLAAWWQHALGLRPLLKLGYTLNWQSGLGVFGFHLTNLLLHLANVALLWHLSAHFPAPTGWNDEKRLHARGFLLVLFALHPIQTEAVTYISGRSMSQMTLFILAGLLLWLQNSRRHRGAALACFAAAVLSKEVALIAPLLLWLFPGRSRGEKFGLAAFVVATAVALVFAFGYLRLLHEPVARSITDNLVSELNAIYYLLGQLGRPWALDIDPDLPLLHGFSGLTVVQTGLLAAALFAAWRCPWLAFALGWFSLALLPAYSLIPRLDLASERHLYLAGIGVFWLAGLALAHLPVPRPHQIMLATLVLAGVSLTALRNADYRDEISLWQATVQTSPGNARAWNNLGYAYRLAGRLDEARSAFKESLRRDPAYPRAVANLRALEGLAP